MQLCLCASLLPSAGIKLPSTSASETWLSSLNPAVSYISILSSRVQLLCRRPLLHSATTVSSSCCPDTEADSWWSLLPTFCVLPSLYLPHTNWDSLSQGPKPKIVLMILNSGWPMVEVLLDTSSSFVVGECAWPFSKASVQLSCSLGCLNHTVITSTSWLSQHLRLSDFLLCISPYKYRFF